MRVARGPAAHRVRDLTVAIALEGDFAAAHTDGDNALVVATDTMKNTAYAFAKDHLDGLDRGLRRWRSAEHFLQNPQVDRATVNLRGHHWRPLEIAAAPPRTRWSAAARARASRRSPRRVAAEVEAGVEDLIVMKTTRSSFTGFPRDQYTTLPETEDRLMATKIAAVWRYGSPAVDLDETFLAVRTTLLEVFAEHDSPSVQTSIWIMGRAILDRHEEVEEVRMVLPNLHHWRVDLRPFGVENDRGTYIATTEPHGLIEATVRRGEG